MAYPGRALARRAGRHTVTALLHLLSLWLAAPACSTWTAPAGKATPSTISIDAELIRFKQERVSRLRRMLASPGLPDRGERLFRLAELELELAVLREAARPGSGDWEAPALTGRRLLLEEPAYRRTEVLLFLSRLQLRRGLGREAVALLEELEASKPGPTALCQGRLVAGEAWSAAADPRRAVRNYRSALLSCSGKARDLARHRLAWALLADWRFAEAAAELRKLVVTRSSPPSLRERALGDLVLAWSHLGEPSPDAVALLLAQGQGGLGARLVLELGERLLEARRLAPLLQLTAQTAELPATARSRLQALRLRALARLGTFEALEQELAALPRPAPPGLWAAAAGSRLELAARLARSGAARERWQAELLFVRVAEGGSPEEVQRAQMGLGELRWQRGDRAGAIAALEAALRVAGPRREDAGYRLLQLLEEAVSDPSPPGQKAARERLCQAAWRHAREFPTSRETADVLLLLATHELLRGRARAAATAAERFLSGFPGHRRRAEGARLLLAALEGGGQWERAYELALAEQRQCGAADREAWSASAARAALRRGQELSRRGAWTDAERWLARSLDLASHTPLADEARLAAGSAALRRERFEEAEQLYGVVAGRAGPRQQRALLLLAELHEARADFLRAVPLYRRAGGLAATAADRLELLRRAAAASVAGRDQASARRAAAELARAVETERLSEAERQRWRLRAGTLLHRAGASAGRYFQGLAAQLERERPRLAARFLLRAAAVADRGARSLLEGALELAGRRRGGKLAAEAAEARLALVRLDLQRAQHLPAGSARRLLALQRQLPLLLEVLSSDNGKLAAEAGLELAHLHEELAATLRAGRPPRGLRAAEREEYRAALASRAAELEADRRQLLERLGRLASKPQGLDRASLRAARLLAGPVVGALAAGHLPAPSPAAQPSLAQLQAGRPRAAALAATRMISLVGERHDLLCVRALSALALERPAAAERDLRAALEANPRSRCARLNLGVLALWRGNPAAARELLEPLEGVDSQLLLLAAPAGPLQPRSASASGKLAEEPGLESVLRRQERIPAGAARAATQQESSP